MEKRYYLDGKCIFSYDDEVFSSDEDYKNIMELFIDPIREMVYEKYYQKQLIQHILEKVFKENAAVFHAYCDVKTLIENEDISVEYIQDDDETLFKSLMREKLDSDEFRSFEALLVNAGDLAFNEEMSFLSSRSSMTEHFWVERGNSLD